MKYSIDLSPRAINDIQTAVDYYNSQQYGLGKRFFAVVSKTMAGVRKMPLAASLAFDEARYKTVNKFPYIIVYRVKGNTIFVARVFNTYQDPAY